MKEVNPQETTRAYAFHNNKENSRFISLQSVYFIYLQGNKHRFYEEYNR